MPDVKPSSDKVSRKVIILSICEKLDNLTKQELMQTALETMYMDYFQFSALLDELEDEKLLNLALRKGETSRTASGHAPERYSLTPQGLTVLNTLRKHLPIPVSAYLERVMQERGQSIKAEQSSAANWQVLPNGHYQVSLSLFESGSRFFHLEIDVPNEKQAVRLCQNWKNNAASVYPAILMKLDDSSYFD